MVTSCAAAILPASSAPRPTDRAKRRFIEGYLYLDEGLTSALGERAPGQAPVIGLASGGRVMSMKGLPGWVGSYCGMFGSTSTSTRVAPTKLRSSPMQF